MTRKICKFLTKEKICKFFSKIKEIKILGVTISFLTERYARSTQENTRGTANDRKEIDSVAPTDPIYDGHTSEKTKKLDYRDSKYVQSLRTAENYFLEVLITHFVLKRHGSKCELTVYFDDDTPTICSREAKYDVECHIKDFGNRAFFYQKELDGFLFEGEKEDYEFNKPDFPFRYASGGALPIVQLGETRYYCLFYRDISPIGWNIANGGCDTLNELRYPLDTIERELREELIIINKSKKTRCVFPSDAGKPLDHPEFDTARRLWQEHLSHLDIPSFHEDKIYIEWIKGPDEVTIKVNGLPENNVSGCFININAEDFGIEVDNVAVIKLDENLNENLNENAIILLDGEICQNQLVNRIIGLFEVDKLENLAGIPLNRWSAEFLPQHFFYNGELHKDNTKGNNLKEVIDKSFLPHVVNIRNNQEIKHYESAKYKFNLCPITKRILKRYLIWNVNHLRK